MKPLAFTTSEKGNGLLLLIRFNVTSDAYMQIKS